MTDTELSEIVEGPAKTNPITFYAACRYCGADDHWKRPVAHFPECLWIAIHRHLGMPDDAGPFKVGTKTHTVREVTTDDG